MPRANRYFTKGRVWHITHRCHNREFLLRFARDRDAYTRLLRESLSTSTCSLLNYCLTSNHVHLLIRAGGDEDVPQLMKKVAGEFAQAYNRRKGLSGAFWGDRYHATLIDSGRYLWRCLLYIDLNMVRAGVVDHPEQWKWRGYQELAGKRMRYRLIKSGSLMESLGCTSKSDFQKNYAGALTAWPGVKSEREPCWTESLAVGSERFINEGSGSLKNRRRTEVYPLPDDPDVRVLREPSNECQSP